MRTDIKKSATANGPWPETDMTAHSSDLHDFDAPAAPALPGLNASLDVQMAGGPEAVAHNHAGNRLYRRTLKRLFDVTLIVLSMPFWIPLVALAALLVARDGHNPFYSQDRVGRRGRTFRMWKLRSMVIDADARLEAHLASDPTARAEWDRTQKLKDDPRITSLGRILRKTSLDELPQLVNVLSGDMSLVGPRPMMVSQRDLYHGASYYRLRPGLTGFWQISERNECRFRDRVRFDDAYEGALSLGTDLAVLTRTVSVVVRGTGY